MPYAAVSYPLNATAGPPAGGTTARLKVSPDDVIAFVRDVDRVDLHRRRSRKGRMSHGLAPSGAPV